MHLPRAVILPLLLATALSGQERTGTAATTIAGVALDDARFAELQQLLTPDADAPWRSIPWQIDLLAAQRAAAIAHKPLFIWAMDGHPLGCT